MDMLMFPYNRMFATVPATEKKAATYAVLLNGERIPFTKQLYWRKDFLEQSPAKYAAYLQRGGHNFLEMYFTQKKLSETQMQKLEGKLFISKQMGEAWAVWYCRFAGYNPRTGDLIELKKYGLDFRGGHPVITDSTVIYTQQQR